MSSLPSLALVLAIAGGAVAQQPPPPPSFAKTSVKSLAGKNVALSTKNVVDGHVGKYPVQLSKNGFMQVEGAPGRMETFSSMDEECIGIEKKPMSYVTIRFLLCNAIRDHRATAVSEDRSRRLTLNLKEGDFYYVRTAPEFSYFYIPTVTP